MHIACIFVHLSTARWSVDSLVWPDMMMEFGTKLLFSKYYYYYISEFTLVYRVPTGHGKPGKS